MRLIPAQFVKPFLKSNKNDFLDAEAIAEAVARQNMRFVPIKTDDQLDLQALHRVRDRLVQRRTAVINQIRGFLIERGITFARGPAQLRNQMAEVLEDAEQPLAAHAPVARRALGRVEAVGGDIAEADDEIERIAKRRGQLPAVARDSRSGAAGGHGDGCGRRQWRGVSQGARLCRLARLGSHASARPAARRACSGSASAAIFICAACSSTERAPWCFACATTRAVLANGCNSSRRAPRPTKSSWRWRTSSHESPGQCCSGAKPTETRRLRTT